MKLASQASALDCMGELGVCVMVFVVKAHDARLAHLIHNFLTYLLISCWKLQVPGGLQKIEPCLQLPN